MLLCRPPKQPFAASAKSWRDLAGNVRTKRQFAAAAPVHALGQQPRPKNAAIANESDALVCVIAYGHSRYCELYTR
jgi:hypothetical protein